MAIVNRLEMAETTTKQDSALREITVHCAKSRKRSRKKDVQSILNGIADNLNEQDRDDLKEILSGLIDRIVFDFSNLEYCINYKIPVKSRELVASPTRFELVLPP